MARHLTEYTTPLLFDVTDGVPEELLPHLFGELTPGNILEIRERVIQSVRNKLGELDSPWVINVRNALSAESRTRNWTVLRGFIREAETTEELEKLTQEAMTYLKHTGVESQYQVDNGVFVGDQSALMFCLRRRDPEGTLKAGFLTIYKNYDQKINPIHTLPHAYEAVTDENSQMKTWAERIVAVLRFDLNALNRNRNS